MGTLRGDPKNGIGTRDRIWPGNENG
jgi:hypothetical protein